MERTIRVASLRAPDARDLRGMKYWIENQIPLSWEERGPILGGTDFVALVEKQEECWLDKIVERALSKCFPRDVGSSSVLAWSDCINSARASLPRRSNVVLAKIQTFFYAASTGLMY